MKATVLALLIAARGIPVCAAQQLGTVPPPQQHVVSWTEGLLVLSGAAVLLAADPQVSLETTEHPTPQATDAASVFRVAGDSRFFAAVSLGTLGAGWVSGNDAITRTGAQLAVSGALAAATFGVVKFALGRSRPDAGHGAYDLHPFSGAGSFPSGHTATAFAMATTLGDAVGNPWVSGGLYLFAAGTAWSRVYDARHWPSDVFVGAALGITSAKLVNGRWRVFGLQSPKFLVGPNEAGLQLQF
jgi:membrane-associated phospholipid phosphatase